MPAPNTPNTAAATAARRRIGLEKAAAKLRDAGWKVVPPDELSEPEMTEVQLREALDRGRERGQDAYWFLVDVRGTLGLLARTVPGERVAAACDQLARALTHLLNGNRERANERLAAAKAALGAQGS